jgi:hypothetical protein
MMRSFISNRDRAYSVQADRTGDLRFTNSGVHQRFRFSSKNRVCGCLIKLNNYEKLGCKKECYIAINEVLMTEKKKPISIREFVERMKAIRKRPVDPKFIEEFNKIMEKDEAFESDEQKKHEKKIARPPEADL